MVGGTAVVFIALAAAGAQGRFDAEAVRLNNRGVAQMGQQFTERAADSFAAAFKKDPKLAQAVVNEGIALLTLQRIDVAKKALEQGIALDPESAQAWYNLGLAEHAGNELESALASFQGAVKLDPRDAACVGGVCPGAGAAAFGPHSGSEGAFSAIPAYGQRQDFVAHRPLLRRTGPLFDRNSDCRAGSGPEGDDSGEAGGAADDFCYPTLAAQTRTRQGWGTRTFHHYRRGVHDGRGRKWPDGPGAGAGGRAGDSRAPQQG